MIEAFTAPAAWAKLLEIFWINMVLSADNALVVALAVRALPARQQRWGIVFAVLGIVVLRIGLTLGVDLLAQLPWLKLLGAVLLLVIGIQLLASRPVQQATVGARRSMWAALGMIWLADLSMSLDNALAVAAAAAGNRAHIVAGLAASIPLVVLASGALLALIRRFALIVTLGAALIGFVAGKMALDDAHARARLEQAALRGQCANAAQPQHCLTNYLRDARMLAGGLGAITVITIGELLRRRASRRTLKPTSPP